MMAREAALKEVVDGQLRRLLAYDGSLNNADVQIGDPALSYKFTNKMGAPPGRGRAIIPDVGGSDVKEKFQSQTFKVARKQVEEKDVEDGELDPFHARARAVGSAPLGTRRAEGYGGRDGCGWGGREFDIKLGYFEERG